MNFGPSAWCTQEILSGALAPARLILQPAWAGAAALEIQADLISGQKTGFFLDQRANIQLAAGLVRSQVAARGASPFRARPFRILDLCCYVGQWASQLAAAVSASGVEVEATLVDSSVKALELAGANARAQGASVILEKRDVLETLRALPERHYDAVICDPPAFVKKKKDLPAGLAAYAKLNREAMRRLAPDGCFVSCSCSGLLSDDDFRSALARAAAGNADLDLRFVARGAHAGDHPQLPQFSQGSYLKCWIGLSAESLSASKGERA